MEENKIFWMCANLAGLGHIRLNRLLETFGNISKVFSLSAAELKDAGIPKKTAEKIIRWEALPWKEELDFCKKNGISIITREDAGYPVLLKQIFDPPIILYLKGSLPGENDMLFSIVGTRNPSPYGLKMAEKFAMELSYCGFIIVSGLARGIDTAAHKGALKAGGRTIGVTGCGFRHCYPRENSALSEKITKNGAVITEFPSYAPPEPQNFPRRNRIVSGLSKGVLVIEAGQKSGALITAHLAIDQGREVFSLPGRIDALSSKGTNLLLKEGATLAENVQEIIQGLNLQIQTPKKQEKQPDISLSESEQSVFNCINRENRAISVDELLAYTGINQSTLFQALLSLISKNLVRELPGKAYLKKQAD